MPATYPAVQRFIDITSAACGAAGAVGINSINRIDYRVTTKRIRSSGDADKTNTFLAKGLQMCQGVIHMEDAVQAHALLALAANDFTFTGLNPITAKVMTVIVKGCLFFDTDGSQVHDEVGKTSIAFEGFLATAGDPQPVTQA